jgi:HAD superfamily hydrolase (TIGR01509 family)
MSIRIVFFDLGGTLVVMRRDYVIRKILKQEGYDVPLKKIHEAYYETEGKWLKKYGMKMMDEKQSLKAYSELNMAILSNLNLKAGKEEIERLKKIVSEKYVEVENSIKPRLYPDSLPTLKYLRNKGYRIGIISNAPPSTADSVKKLGLDKYAEPILISGIVGVTKPNPEIFKLALKLSGTEPENAVHVGDVYEADVLGARSAGMKAVLIDREDRFTDPDCPRIRKLTELPLLLNSL